MNDESNSDRFPERKIRQSREDLIVFRCNTHRENYRQRRATILAFCLLLFLLVVLVAIFYGIAAMVISYVAPVVGLAFYLEHLYLKRDKRGEERDGE